MAGFGRGAAILISIILGTLILPILGISGIFSLIIIGFIANYLTISNQRTYKVGGIAGGILGFLIFIYGFFVSPQLPDLPSLSGFQMISLELGGLFTLFLGFIILIAVSAGFGCIGGWIADKVLKKRSKMPEKHVKKNKNHKKANNKPKRTLNKR